MDTELTRLVALTGLITRVSGLVLGVIGTVLGIMNFRRDAARISVSLAWDLKMTGADGHETEESYGVVTISNVGRRPSFVSHVAIEVPGGHDHTHLVLWGSINGVKLAEGDAPLIYPVPQGDMGQYAGEWRRVVAQMTDTTGRIWRSARPKRRPNWPNPASP
jgi:hypothetical protein